MRRPGPRSATLGLLALPAAGVLLFGLHHRLALAAAPAAAATPSDPAAVEQFEREIRPLLVEKCQVCHDDRKRSGGLRLTDRAGLLAGGARGPAVTAGQPEQSLVLQAVRGQGPLKMPPGGRLSGAEIERLRRWIERGAVWPEGPAVAPAALTAERHRRWWAFRRPASQVVPPTLEAAPGARIYTPIDRFILKELPGHGLRQSTPADKRTLLRRATFDLTGLPPTPEEVAAFLGDHSPTAFAKVVDRLLASSAYGERWARRWLDVVRYTDYHDGDPKARTVNSEPLNAWRYRDWVVSALNRDLPFDQFIVHQIAGDLLPLPEGAEFYADGLVATTFLSNGSWDRGDADKEKMVSDMVDDQVDTIGKAFLGLTLGCARCHDHKFDPISQKDYYGLAGILYSTHILEDQGSKGGEYKLNRIPMAPRAYVAQWREQNRRLKELKDRLAELDKKSPKPPDNDPARVELVRARDRLQAELVPDPPLAEAAQEGGTAGNLFPGIQDVPIHIRGSYTQLGAVVPRRMPAFFAGEAQSPIRTGSGRLELARWVAAAQNPLTARVIVNRVWQGHFGSGLVKTPSNFGTLSEPPSHPELLDWLAETFVREGWSLKKLHRRLMLSATYQQSSAPSGTGASSTLDPENRWLSRFGPRRLDAEEFRDAIVAVTGRLDRTAGGPAGADLAVPRRSLYIQTARWDRSSYAMLFDAANPDASVEKRTVSTVAPQALFLLNHEFLWTQARHLAERLTREAPNPTERIRRAYALLYSREPSVPELELCGKLVPAAGKADETQGWTDLAHMLLCANELAFVD